MTKFSTRSTLSLNVHGESHPNVALLYNTIGNVYRKKGDVDKALEYYSNSLTIYLNMYGENHPKVAMSFKDIGNEYEIKGKLDQALEYHRKSLKVRLKVYGENHADVADAYENVALVLTQMGRGNPESTLAYMENTLRIRHTCIGKDDPDVTRAEKITEELTEWL